MDTSFVWKHADTILSSFASSLLSNVHRKSKSYILINMLSQVLCETIGLDVFLVAVWTDTVAKHWLRGIERCRNDLWISSFLLTEHCLSTGGEGSGGCSQGYGITPRVWSKMCKFFRPYRKSPLIRVLSNRKLKIEKRLPLFRYLRFWLAKLTTFVLACALKDLS